MPQSKDQPARIRVINECLSQNGTYWTKQELLDKMLDIDIDIEDRTLEADITDMRRSTKLGYRAPIKWCRVHKGYHYTERDYSIDKLPLNKDDVRRLEWAATTLSQYQGIPLMREFTTTIDKIIRVVNRVKRGNYETILDFIEFEKTPPADGLKHMDGIIEAIQSARAIQLTYHSFDQEAPKMVTLHPYFIKEYRNRWYVIGYHQEEKMIKTYAYDRILEIDQSASLYIKNTTFDKSKYLSDCIGIGLGSREKEHIVLQFVPRSGKYVTTQPLHHSQNVMKNDNEAVIISLDVIVNYELISTILSYGNFVRVIEPASLISTIKETAQLIIEQYQPAT
ncbi:WYL domain-containing protein [Mucilaginibacter sp. HC2]|uniref:helix-turn-helix transcriptional regulator n=1 Tax=Mucilaginibacter inviolabilis TaxID=2714892 RepID=UPI00140824E4|nr:WYL domain-containing protein [Mucilaginibacter inviolabilis]NHA03467.1 WYL domain-containing protein [Mucilaginibacter inviolabilis]